MKFRINYVKTKDAVQNFMEDYEFLRFRFNVDSLPTMTQQFMLVCPGNAMPRVTSSTERIALKNIELEEKLQDYIEKITGAYNRLNEEEREYLSHKFFSNQKLCDDDIQYKMGLGYRVFVNLKKAAYKKFALGLGIEVYEK